MRAAAPTLTPGTVAPRRPLAADLPGRVEVEQVDSVPEGMVTRTIDAANYAVFTASFEQAGSVAKAYDEIAAWLATSSYVRAQAPGIETHSGPDSDVEIYVPLWRSR